MSLRFHSSISDEESSEQALERLLDDAQAHLESAGVAFLYFTAHHRDHAEMMAEKILLEFEPKALVGCTCEGVIGGDVEIERAPGISLMLGQVPGATVRAFHVST